METWVNIKALCLSASAYIVSKSSRYIVLNQIVGHILSVITLHRTEKNGIIDQYIRLARKLTRQKYNQKHLPYIIQGQMGQVMRKRVLCHMRITKVQIGLRIRAVWSAPLLFAAYIVWYVYLLYPKFQDSS